MNPISSVSSIPSITRPDSIASPDKSGSNDAFRALLEQSVRTVASRESDAKAAVEQFINGEEEDTHKMMLAVQRADLSFELFAQVRNKVVQAYQEVMRMPE